MEPIVDPPAALAVVLAVSLVTVCLVIAWLWKREYVVPAPWEYPSPFHPRR